MTFENDEALDWLIDLEDAPDAAPVRDALRSVGPDPEPTVAVRALAAAEVVAAAFGQPTQAPPAVLTTWVSTHRQVFTSDDLLRALMALDDVDGTAAVLHLTEIDHLDWQHELDDLRERLCSA